MLNYKVLLRGCLRKTNFVCHRKISISFPVSEVSNFGCQDDFAGLVWPSRGKFPYKEVQFNWNALPTWETPVNWCGVNRELRSPKCFKIGGWYGSYHLLYSLESTKNVWCVIQLHVSTISSKERSATSLEQFKAWICRFVFSSIHSLKAV